MIALARLRQASLVLEKEFVPGTIPLSRFLKHWFKANKQMGSKDRKALSSLLYSYYRTAFLFKALSMTDHLLAAQFLLSCESFGIIEELRPQWLPYSKGSFNEKLEIIKAEFKDVNFSVETPFDRLVSNQIDLPAFTRSFFTQPKLFIRIRKGCGDELKKVLTAQELHFMELSSATLSFENRTSLDLKTQDAGGCFEVQDRSSQETASLFMPQPESVWWDACAGSGGKSLLLADTGKDVKIHASDYRASILVNLRERFLQAGVAKAKVFQADLLENVNIPPDDYFDGIILDAPCTGSGTWSRTPEMLRVFNGSKVESYQLRQLRMAMNVLPCLKAKGALIYITCSVFTAENEWIVERLLQTGALKLVSQEYFKGYDRGADTLFGARFIKI